MIVPAASSPSVEPARGGWAAILGLLGLVNAGNGTWMLLDAEGWFHDLPAGVADFGPLNEHMIRDLGGAFVVMGAALLWAALRPALRRPLSSLVALFYLLHAAGHVVDTAEERVGPEHWTIDLPGVYIPALLFTAIAIRFALPRVARAPDRGAGSPS